MHRLEKLISCIYFVLSHINMTIVSLFNDSLLFIKLCFYL